MIPFFLLISFADNLPIVGDEPPMTVLESRQANCNPQPEIVEGEHDEFS